MGGFLYNNSPKIIRLGDESNWWHNVVKIRKWRIGNLLEIVHVAAKAMGIARNGNIRMACYGAWRGTRNQAVSAPVRIEKLLSRSQ